MGSPLGLARVPSSCGQVGLGGAVPPGVLLQLASVECRLLAPSCPGDAAAPDPFEVRPPCLAPPCFVALTLPPPAEPRAPCRVCATTHMTRRLPLPQPPCGPGCLTDCPAALGWPPTVVGAVTAICTLSSGVTRLARAARPPYTAAAGCPANPPDLVAVSVLRDAADFQVGEVTTRWAVRVAAPPDSPGPAVRAATRQPLACRPAPASSASTTSPAVHSKGLPSQDGPRVGARAEQ